MSTSSEPTPEHPLHAFDGLGVEIEYMIVDRDSLDVRPIADRLLVTDDGSVRSEVEHGDLAWSNELVLHVIELKTNGPADDLDTLPSAFQHDVQRIDEQLAAHGARLMPTAMHPWMDPLTETRLWPHEYSPVYQAYNRIFDCRGHGWSNLQSLHLNLPFADDDEFARLHAGIRLLLPILPALAASSPFADGVTAHGLDHRMEVYRTNSQRIPSLAGQIIPEAVFSRQEYERRILQPMYRDVAPFDTEGVLQHDFLNSRGAIPRFGRGSIEIRVIDVQECPRADLAIGVLIVSVLKLLHAERFTDLEHQQSFDTDSLAALLRRTIVDADRVRIHDLDYLHALGLSTKTTVTAGELWKHLLGEVYSQPAAPDTQWQDTLETMLERGCLARHIRGRLDLKPGATPSREALTEVYRELCDCLREDRIFA